MDLPCRIFEFVLVIVTSSFLVSQGSKMDTCRDGEFTCDTGLCIPEIQRCDVGDDCGDFSDEDASCTYDEACLNYAESLRDIPCMFPDNILYENSMSTEPLSFVFDTADMGAFSSVLIEKSFASAGIVRCNITTSSDRTVVYIYPTSTIALFSVPFAVYRGDVVIISMERSEDPPSTPWTQVPVPPGSITGFTQDRSCHLNAACREWVVTSTLPEIDKCSPLQVAKFGLKWFKKCLPFCLEDFFTELGQVQLTFPRTDIGKTAFSVEKCPASDVPLASRKCIGQFTRWEDPVLNNCDMMSTDKIATLESLAEIYKFYSNNDLDDSNVLSVSDEVLAATGSPQDGGDTMKLAIALLEKIVAVGNSSARVTSNVLQIVDNILSDKENNFVRNLTEIDPSRIWQTAENQLTHLQTRDEPTNFTFVGSSVATHAIHLSPSVLNSFVMFATLFASSAKDVTEPFSAGVTFVETVEMLATKTEKNRCVVMIPAAVLRKIGQNGTVPVTFAVYRPSLLFNNRSTINKPLRKVGSVILATKIEGHTVRDLEDPIMFRFHINNDIVKGFNTTKQCVSWQYASNGSEGRWSSSGCQMQNRPDNSDEGSLTECHCVHLTNFAVLMDVHGDIDSAALDVLSTIGCVVSIVALTITIITFLAVKKMRERRSQQILLNLCFALLGLYLFFILGINRIQTETGCVIFGALIHFFCLSSVAWMAVEATNMYLLFVRVFDSGVLGFMWKAMLVGWGLPFVAVLLCVVIAPQNYRSTYCFPRSGTQTFNFGVLFLVACILLYNVIIFVVVFYKLYLARSQIKSSSSRPKDVTQQAQSVVSISVLLGLTWIFGFLTLSGARLIFDLLFLLFCSLQGLFVFLLFCLRQKEARDAWKNCFGFKEKESSIGVTNYSQATMTSK